MFKGKEQLSSNTNIITQKVVKIKLKIQIKGYFQLGRILRRLDPKTYAKTGVNLIYLLLTWKASIQEQRQHNWEIICHCLEKPQLSFFKKKNNPKGKDWATRRQLKFSVG